MSCTSKRSKNVNKTHNQGYVYVLADDAHPGWCKVGRSKRMWSRLSAAYTFAPTIRCVATFGSDNEVIAEERVHALLNYCRIAGTEWYACSIDEACTACLNIIIRKEQTSLGTTTTPPTELTKQSKTIPQYAVDTEDIDMDCGGICTTNSVRLGESIFNITVYEPQKI